MARKAVAGKMADMTFYAVIFAITGGFMRDIAVLYLSGGSASTAVLPTEIFRYTGALWNALRGEPCAPPFRVTTASLNGGPVRIDDAIGLVPQRAVADLGRPDLVFVPAGGVELDAMIDRGYDIDAAIARNAGVVAWLRRWADQGVKIAGVCTGVSLLAEAGLLDGKRATTHWGVVDLYRERFPSVDWRPEFLVTDAEAVYCGGGINAAADLSLYLVEKFCGRGLAMECAKAMLIEMPRRWQTAFAHLAIGTDHGDSAIARAQDRLHRNYARPLRFDALAADLGMSPRNFARRFKEATGRTPLDYLQALRVAVAKRLLENGGQTVQEVVHAVGYEDALYFRNLFRRHTGLSPAAYRQRFGGARPAA